MISLRVKNNNENSCKCLLTPFICLNSLRKAKSWKAKCLRQNNRREGLRGKSDILPTTLLLDMTDIYQSVQTPQTVCHKQFQMA